MLYIAVYCANNDSGYRKEFWRILLNFLSAITALILVLLAANSQATELRIAVASNFTGTMKTIVKEFEGSSPYKVSISSGSSGKLYAQIRQGAPFDIFFSADQTKPLKLDEEDLVIKDSLFTYAVGSLVLWTTSDIGDSEDIQLPKERLTKMKFNKLAMANPKLAPYGQAATEVLASLNLVDKSSQKRVLGENIAQTYQFVATGNAELGFIAASQLTELQRNDTGQSWIIPKTLYSPINQDAVLLTRAKDNPIAQAFLTFFTTKKVQAIIAADGYRGNSQFD